MLRLVETVSEVVSLNEAAAKAELREALRAEAAEIEAGLGKNAYSEFLLRHGQRPDRKQAATLGQLMGTRVKASDGSMQPQCSKIERDDARAVRDQRRKRERNNRQVSTLLQAIAGLAEICDSPADVLSHLHPQFDETIIREHLGSAVEWLMRFAEEWTRRDNHTNEEVSEPS